MKNPVSYILDTLKEIRNVNKTACVAMALTSKGYHNFVLANYDTIEAHVERHSTVPVEIIIDSFVNTIEQTKTIKKAFRKQRGES